MIAKLFWLGILYAAAALPTPPAESGKATQTPTSWLHRVETLLPSEGDEKSTAAASQGKFDGHWTQLYPPAIGIPRWLVDDN